jgi:isopenicillin N synthase-like dioxygenase
MATSPIIRRRIPSSQRRRDGLIQFARDSTSQNGEDGIISKLFEILPASGDTRFCVDVGAWDGRHLSNTYSLLVSETSNWRGVLIEADKERFQELDALHKPFGNTCLNVTVSSAEGSSDGLVALLQKPAESLPLDFDFLCIDVDGSDYWLVHDVWTVGQYRPKVVCIEFNPTMPDDLVYIPARNDSIRHGASLSALVELANENGYVLVETTLYNAFFVTRVLYQTYLQDLVPDTSIEALHEITMGTSLYQLYDGTLKLWGCKKLLWHRMAIDERKLQMIQPEERHFPFAPPDVPEEDFSELAIDMSSYSGSESNPEAQRSCAESLINTLRRDGYCLIRGTGISNELCEAALRSTKSFLQDADESVRRSCLTKDRARRGYSPMCTENFASLIGEQGPNDLVRKFRMGPCAVDTEAERNSLLAPNVWPSTDVWDHESCSDFQSSLEDFYEQACAAAHSVVRAICSGATKHESQIESPMSVLSMKDSLSHTSILTLLGYRKGSRHAKSKKKHMHPLVATHTDVGVITMLLFDAGDCAVLQRKDTSSGSKEPWANVVLPSRVPSDPIFIVNIADCLSDLSDGDLPSTLHRVVPGSGVTPRSCLALFVGLDPKESLTIKDERMTYEEWRKRRIAAAQSVLKASSSEIDPSIQKRDPQSKT